MGLQDKRLLAVFAHPDDESFCCGGSLALAAKAGVRIKLLCATKGEDGQWHGNPLDHKDLEKEAKLAAVRAEELRRAGAILGIEEIEFLGFIDGLLNNRELPRLRQKIKQQIDAFQPQAVLTFDRSGISGHIDHIAVSLATTAVVSATATVERLYHCAIAPTLSRRIRRERKNFPPALVESGVKTVRYAIDQTWEIKQQAVMAHQTQKKDWQQVLPLWEKLPKFEYFKLIIERKPPLGKVPFF